MQLTTIACARMRRILNCALASAALCACGRPPARAAGELGHLLAHPGGCRECHRVSSDAITPIARAAWPCAAGGCHAEIAGATNILHGPMVTGDCAVCHVPHSSIHSGLARAGDPQLCTRCHTELRTCAARSLGLSSECLRCHDPHGGDARSFLKAAAAR